MNKIMIKIEKILKQLVSFDTVNDNQNDKIINWISEFSLKAGFKTKILKNKRDNKSSLIVNSGNSNKNGLIFLGHTDTVPAGTEWKTNPFKLTQKNNAFFGLGSSDMKGGIATMLAVINEINLSKLNKGLELIFTYDEEKSFKGIKNVIEKHKILADCILIGEPTELKPVIATKGVLRFEVNFIGKEAHGSSPENGVNAIEMASGFIIELRKYFKELKKDNCSVFISPHATFNIAIINGGDAINKVPSSCLLEFEFRIIDNRQHNKIKKDIASLIKRNRSKAKIRINFCLPVVKCQNKKFVNTIEKIAKKKAIGVNYATEASFLPSQNNFVILGPGSIEFAHQANENVKKNSLYKAVGMYKELINKFCV